MSESDLVKFINLTYDRHIAHLDAIYHEHKAILEGGRE